MIRTQNLPRFVSRSCRIIARTGSFENGPNDAQRFRIVIDEQYPHRIEPVRRLCSVSGASVGDRASMGRQRDRERRALALASARNRDDAFVKLDQVLNDREPKPETGAVAAIVGVRLPESLEDVRKKRWSDPDPRIRDRQLDLLIR